MDTTFWFSEIIIIPPLLICDIVLDIRSPSFGSTTLVAPTTQRAHVSLQTPPLLFMAHRGGGNRWSKSVCPLEFLRLLLTT